MTITAGSAVKADVSLVLAMPGESGRMPWGARGAANRQQNARARGGGASRTGGEAQRAGASTGAAGGLGIPGIGQQAGAAGSDLRFSQDNIPNVAEAQGADAGRGSQASPEGAEPSTSASADNNSFLLTGNTVNAAAPAQQSRRGEFRFRRFGGGGGAQTAPGFGGRGGMGSGGMVFFFGGNHRPRVNKLRGNLFDSYSNSALDARPYPLNVSQSPQIPSYSERAGVSLGGPLSIPKIYNGSNKTSFFVHYSLQRSKSPFDLFGTVPTAAERQGDFSNTVIQAGPQAGNVPAIYNPFSSPSGPRTPFPGNQIPESMVSPAAKGLLSYIPLPNLPGAVQNFHLQESLPTASDFVMGRVGQQISSKDNAAVFYFFNSNRGTSVSSFPELTSQRSTRNQNVNLMETHSFSAHTVNTLMANFNRSRISLLNPFAFNQDIASQLGILGVSQNPMNWGIPIINFTNFTGLNDVIPSLARDQTFRLSDSVILNRGNHNFRVGGEFRKVQLNSLSDPDARGTFTFSGYTTSDFTGANVPVTGTGFDFADFLLGLPQTTAERFGASANYLRSSVYDAFGEDDWRFDSHLTFNLGLRYEYAAPFTEKYGRLSDLALGPGFSTVGVVTGQNPGDLPSSLLHGQTSNWAPRIGIAYRPWVDHSLVIRVGYGVFYDESIYQHLVPNLVNQPPFATSSTLVTSSQNVLTLENGFPEINPTVARNTYAADPNFFTPYAQTWDFMMEQNIARNTVLTLAYIGTRGTHLNLLLAPNTALAGAVTAGSQPTLVTNALPFIYDTSGAESIYQGLRVGVRRWFHNGFSFFANYTYSKALDNAASVGGTGNTVAQNPFDLQSEWGLSDFNPTHDLRLFTSYRLPFGDRQPFLNHGGTLARIVGDWRIGDSTDIDSGTPLTAFILGNLSNNVNGSAPFSSLRADATGLPVDLPGFEQTT
ncbi:MAG TPA: hypothetical protein VFZ08_13845, partial [Terriglobia bacterium]|nr:hypothetical protein [Terriglobia bacterium]